MFHVVLYQPEIPSNTGNLIRLCANTGSELHLIEPLGFSLEDRQLRRAGLDYRDVVAVHVHDDFAACRKSAGATRLATFSTHHQRLFTNFRFQPGDMLLFGPETRGLPKKLAQAAEESARLTIPMLPANRSLNLSNAAAVVVYEGWRQLNFAGYKSLEDC
jgi:tRNA (cytidine/uridine-2'-O-)-methyltransferase